MRRRQTMNGTAPDLIDTTQSYRFGMGIAGAKGAIAEATKDRAI